MEQGVDELRGHLHESGQVGLHGCVDVVVLVRSNLEILFELRFNGISLGHTRKHGRRTLKRCFSSFRDFSFLSLSLVSELLNRS